MEVNVDEIFMSEIESDNLNSLDLRHDIENDNIYGCILCAEGYVGNKPSEFKGDHHEDDTWAIDCYYKGGEITSYLYTSEYEYIQDVELLKEF